MHEPTPPFVSLACAAFDEKILECGPVAEICGKVRTSDRSNMGFAGALAPRIQCCTVPLLRSVEAGHSRHVQQEGVTRRQWRNHVSARVGSDVRFVWFEAWYVLHS